MVSAGQWIARAQFVDLRMPHPRVTEVHHLPSSAGPRDNGAGIEAATFEPAAISTMYPGATSSAPALFAVRCTLGVGVDGEPTQCEKHVRDAGWLRPEGG